MGYQLYATGNESTRTVTIKLNEAGYTWPRPDGTRMPFHKDGVVEMLKSCLYWAYSSDLVRWSRMLTQR